MIKIENTYVDGWAAAIRGMRNPLNSWDKSDSNLEGTLGCWNPQNEMCEWFPCEDCFVGPNDLALMQKLAAAGTDHGKFLRMITITADITAPLYWWKEYDTYKVGTVANSCSTMHKIADKEFTDLDFSLDHVGGYSCFMDPYDRYEFDPKKHFEKTRRLLNHYRRRYLETGDKKYWWQIVTLLPSNYNQRRTVQLNYQVAHAVHEARKNHKLDEWHVFCDWVERLPYYREIFGGVENG